MKAAEYPVTTAVRLLRQKEIPFVPHLYPYEEHGGTGHAAKCLAVEEHLIIKTLVMMSESPKVFLVLMHGDREVSTKQLARQLGVKHVDPADTITAQRVTGYQVGGISPFGTRQTLPVYVESSILSLPRLFINGGKRGFLVEIAPDGLRKGLTVSEVHVGVEE